ncbi:acetolactate synthase [Cloacibacillus sp. An23]|uniref:acetolactate synthase n=1 Tax=Cloacibacillus sp. An23 TaxID=1965591 RepID=UPI000B38FFE4|nr:acetolactate synthase [Cloacibacillus sp. An23]OUO94416.1 acetolactate synthase [Cloacibacillus sp. An23]
MKGDKEMTVKQISVFLENKPGKLAEFVELLRSHGIDMRALSLAEASDFGIARVIVDDPEKAHRVLKEAGSIASVTPVIAISVSDTPGALYEMLEAMREGDINIEYTYAFTTRKDQGAYMVFRVADKSIDEAVKLLEKHGIKIVAQEDIYKL